MSFISGIGGVFHKIVNGIHSIFVEGQHAVEQATIFIEGRPGLKADLDALTGPIKDAVIKAMTDKWNEVKAADPVNAVSLMKTAIPALAADVVKVFSDQAHHAGNVNLLVSIAIQAGEALLGL